ncbi:MAG: glycerol-3-phosphate O-acyltransferase [Paraglaciecola sp.]|jgi:glycerol-3-phosphate O-acyltransferase
MAESSKIFPHVIEQIEDWPIYKLHEDRDSFVAEMDEFTTQRLLKTYKEDISDIVAKTVYLERIRMKEEPWKVDPPNDNQFWRKIRKTLVKKSLDKETTESKEETIALLRRIVHRYSEEIVGTFRKPTFQFARRFLSLFFNRLLNTAAGRNLKRIYGTRYHLYERILTRGEIETVRSLMTKGTVVIVPTHFSNLDSILIGWAMDRILGLPSFSYAAGLNLYNTGYTAYFMNRLGAYRLDRRKKNPIYLEAVKAMSNLAIQHGTNSLFFPGGTRARSGKLEDKLKKGMLGTVMEAQRANFEKGKDGKVFIVPLVLGYHTVLEAKFLIEQHLKKTGKEQYLSTKDETYSARKLLNFGWNFFSQSSEITLSFGKPMDVMGNFVDEDGTSFDRFGREVDVKDYFVTDGKVKMDLQREFEYTNILANRIVERYHKENIILTSHFVAFAAFHILKNDYPKLDLYGVLRQPTEDYFFSMSTLEKVVTQMKEQLLDLEKKGKLKLSRQIRWSTDKLIADGIANMGIYHPEKPLIFDKKGQLVSQDFKLLYYYHNRMDSYGVEKGIDWKMLENEQRTLLMEEI